MKFRLTYDGPLESSGTAKHKHEIRKAFHPQLKRLWRVEPNLRVSEYADLHTYSGGGGGGPDRLIETLANDFARAGYRFVPLAMERMSLIAGVEILFLREGSPGAIIRSGDIDNRLKTLFDALRMPASLDELGGYHTPAEGEDPFFVLLEDDKLLNHVSVETDMLLQPTPTAQGQFLTNDCRLVITVHLRPSRVTIGNLHFA